MVCKPNATQTHQLIIDADGGPSRAAPSEAFLVIIHTLRNHEALPCLKRSQVTRFISRWKGPPSERTQRCGKHMNDFMVYESKNLRSVPSGRAVTLREHKCWRDSSLACSECTTSDLHSTLFCEASIDALAAGTENCGESGVVNINRATVTTHTKKSRDEQPFEPR